MKKRRPVPKSATPLVDLLITSVEGKVTQEGRGRVYAALCELAAGLEHSFELNEPIPDEALWKWRDGAAKELTLREFDAVWESIGTYQRDSLHMADSWDEFLTRPSSAAAWRWAEFWTSPTENRNTLAKVYALTLKTWLRHGTGEGRGEKLSERLELARLCLSKKGGPLESYEGASKFICCLLRQKSLGDWERKLILEVLPLATELGRAAAASTGFGEAALPATLEAFVAKVLTERVAGGPPSNWVAWGATPLQTGTSPLKALNATRNQRVLNGRPLEAGLLEAGEYFAGVEGSPADVEGWKNLRAQANAQASAAPGEKKLPELVQELVNETADADRFYGLLEEAARRAGLYASPGKEREDALTILLQNPQAPLEAHVFGVLLKALGDGYPKDILNLGVEARFELVKTIELVATRMAWQGEATQDLLHLLSKPCSKGLTEKERRHLEAFKTGLERGVSGWATPALFKLSGQPNLLQALCDSLAVRTGGSLHLDAAQALMGPEEFPRLEWFKEALAVAREEEFSPLVLALRVLGAGGCELSNVQRIRRTVRELKGAVSPETFGAILPFLARLGAGRPEEGAVQQAVYEVGLGEAGVEAAASAADPSAEVLENYPSRKKEREWEKFLEAPTVEEALRWADRWGKGAGVGGEAYEAILRAWTRNPPSAVKGGARELRALLADADQKLSHPGLGAVYEGLVSLTCGLLAREQGSVERDLLVRYTNLADIYGGKLGPGAGHVTVPQLRAFVHTARAKTQIDGGPPPGWVKLVAAAYATPGIAPLNQLKSALLIQLKYLPGEASPELLEAGRYVAVATGGYPGAWGVLGEALQARGYAKTELRLWPEKNADGSFDRDLFDEYLAWLEGYAPEVYAARAPALLKNYGYDPELHALTLAVKRGRGEERAAKAQAAAERARQLVEVVGGPTALLDAARNLSEDTSVEERMLAYLLGEASRPTSGKEGKEILELAVFGKTGPYATVSRAAARGLSGLARQLAGIGRSAPAEDEGDRQRNEHLTNFYLAACSRDQLSGGATSVLFALTRNPARWARETANLLQDPDRTVPGREVVEAARVLAAFSEGVSATPVGAIATEPSRWQWFEEALERGVSFQRLGFALERIGPGVERSPERAREAAAALRAGMSPALLAEIRPALMRVAEGEPNSGELVRAIEAGLEGRSLDGGVSPPDMVAKKTTVAVEKPSARAEKKASATAKAAAEVALEEFEEKVAPHDAAMWRASDGISVKAVGSGAEEEEEDEDDDEREPGHAWGGEEEASRLASEAARVASVMRAVTEGKILSGSDADIIAQSAYDALCEAGDVSQFTGLRRWARGVLAQDQADEATLGATLIACYTQGFLTLNELEKLESAFRGNAVAAMIRTYRRTLGPEEDKQEALSPAAEGLRRVSRGLFEYENGVDGNVRQILTVMRAGGHLDAAATDGFLARLYHNLPEALARLVTAGEASRDEAVTLINRARVASDKISLLAEELEALLNTPSVRLAEAGTEAAVAPTPENSSDQAGKKKVTRTMKDKLLTTAMQDAKDIALRSSVKQARKMAADLLTNFLSSRTTPRNVGETDESYAARVAENRRGLESFVASEAGQGIISYLLGMGWVVYEDEISDEKVRSVGSAVAREIRIQGGTGVVDDFFKEVVAPMASFAHQSIMSLGAATPAAEEAPKHRFEPETDASRANDARDKEIAELKEQLRRAKAAADPGGDAPSAAAPAALTASAAR